MSLRMQEWHSGESTRLPWLWPRFYSWTWRPMCVEFVVGSSPCLKDFSLGSPAVFLPPQNQLSNFQFDLETGATGLSALLLSATLTK